MYVEKPEYKKPVDYLRQLALSIDQINAYLYLLEHGPQTVLSLSRGLRTGRTKLYPLLESLVERQLIAITERHYGTSYAANAPATIEFLVQEHEQLSQNLRSTLPAALHSLKALQQSAPTTSRTTEYHGIDGLKQALWNVTKASSDEPLLLNHPDLDTFLDRPFIKRFHKALPAHRTLGAEDIDPMLFQIEHATHIYDNTVTLIVPDQLYAVEVQNETLAQQQRQLFELLWKLKKQ